MSDARSPEDLLQSALSSAFTPVSIAPVPPPDPTSAPAAPAPTARDQDQDQDAAHAEPLVSQEEMARYEEERAALERSWREASARQRQEAEERRARMASGGGGGGEGWNTTGEKDIRGPPNPVFQSGGEKVERGGGGGGRYPGSPSPADARDVVSGEPSGGTESRHTEVSEQVSPRTTATLEQSQRWEEVDSLESSYPSLSFPEQSDSAPSSEHAPDAHTKPKPKSKSKSASSDPHASTAHPSRSSTTAHHHHQLPSTTLSIFDPTLPTRARLTALLSSLSINLLLPFVNGVMLGFGEIFARNAASRFFGWGTVSASASASVSVPESESAEIGGRQGARTRMGMGKEKGTPGGAATAVGVGAVPSRRL